MKKLIAIFAALIAYAGMALAGVNINSATKEQLESLDGVGPVKAQAIVDYRKKNGNFKSLDDIKKVDGIGDATFDKIKKDIMLTGTTVPMKPAADAGASKAVVPAKPATPAAPATPAKKADDKKADMKKAEPATPATPAKKADDKKADAKKVADDKKADAKKAADDKKADAKKAAGDKKADAKKVADDKKADPKK